MKWPCLLCGGRRASGDRIDRTQSSMGFSMHGKQSHASARAHAVVVRVPPLAADALCIVSARISRFRPGRLVIIHGSTVDRKSVRAPQYLIAPSTGREILALSLARKISPTLNTHTRTQHLLQLAFAPLSSQA